MFNLGIVALEIHPAARGGNSGFGRSSCRSSLLLLSFLAFLVLAGCAVRPAALPEPQEGMTALSPETCRKKLANVMTKPTALKAVARIDILTSSGRYPLKAAIVLQHPDRLRMESLPLIGPPDFYLILDRGTLKILLPQEGKYYVGTPSPDQLARFLPFLSSDFQLSDMLALLRGTIPQTQDADSTLRGFQEGKYDRLEIYRKARKSEVFWLERETDTLVRAALWGRDGTLRYRAHFEGYGDINEAAVLPAKISVTTGEPNPVTLTLRYTDLQIVEEIQEDLFHLEFPDGFTPLRLDE